MAKYEAKTKNDNCVFCEIVRGNIPSSIFWEDDKHIAFLSIDPNTEGFSVVIPKKHFNSNPLKIPDKTLSQLMIASKKVAQTLENYYKDVGRVGIIMEGTGVNHIHTKIIPMHGTGKQKRDIWQQFTSNHNTWFDKYDGFLSSAGGPMADFSKLKKLSEKIKKSLIK